MKRILYTAGTMSHIRNFHLPYIERLKAEGHEVTVMARGDGANIDMPFEKKMLSPGNLISSLRIRRIIKREKFDTVILNTTLAAFVVRFCMPKRKRPRVINFVHGYMFPKMPKTLRDKIFLLCERALKKKTDYIMVMNSEDYGIAVNYALALNGVKMTRGMGAKVSASDYLPVELRRERKKDTKRFVICFIGELCKNKNQRMLICAMPKIKIRVPSAVLWLVGDGGSKENLRALAEELSITDSVRFWGHKSNPCDFIRAADLYISPSKKEGLPFNVIEALGCGKTVIASDIKGHRDIIEDGKNGFLFKTGNTARLAELVADVFDGKISINPADAVARYERFSFDSVFKETYEIMKELIDK